MSNDEPRSVLIVEDEFLIRMMLAETLADEGFTVVEAGTADEAIGVLQQESGIALMITDLTLPGRMDGVALGQWTRQQHATLPIIYVTGRPDSIAREGLTARDAVMAKPYLPSEIAAAARRMIAL